MCSSSIWHCLYWKVQIDTCSGRGKSVQMTGTSVMEKSGISKGSVFLWDLLWGCMQDMWSPLLHAESLYVWGGGQQDSCHNNQTVRTEQSEGVCVVKVLQANDPKELLIRTIYNAFCLQVISAMPASCCLTLVLVLWSGTSCFPAGIFPFPLS